MNDDRDLQRDLTSTILGSIADHGFVLAGSGAIREHGFVDRLTHDVDLFTNRFDADQFAAAIADATAALELAGYTVVEQRRADLFAHLDITADDGRQADVDFGYDWRGKEPAQLQVGPVLNADDAVASKVGAVYTRGEVRDFIDLDAIRMSGRYTDQRLLELVADRDEGFDLGMFAQQLGRVTVYTDDRFADYGYDAHQARRVRDGAQAWSAALHREPATEQEESAAARIARYARALQDQHGVQRSFAEVSQDAEAAAERQRRVDAETLRNQQIAAEQHRRNQQQRHTF